MDDAEFDRLSRTFADTTSRRRVVCVLTALQLGASGLLGPAADADARPGRNQPRVRQEKKGKGKGKGNKKKPTTTPAPTTTTPRPCQPACRPGERCTGGDCVCDVTVCEDRGGACVSGRCQCPGPETSCAPQECGTAKVNPCSGQVIACPACPPGGG